MPGEQLSHHDYWDGTEGAHLALLGCPSIVVGELAHLTPGMASGPRGAVPGGGATVQCFHLPLDVCVGSETFSRG